MDTTAFAGDEAALALGPAPAPDAAADAELSGATETAGMHPQPSDVASAEAEGEDEEANGDEDEEEGYADEYNSLLFRVAELEAQEEQRTRQQRFTLRMAQREARLMARVVRQQQVYLAARLSQKRDASSHHTGTADAPASASATAANPVSSSEGVACAMERDARLSCFAYRAERAQQQTRKLTDAMTQLRAYTRTLQQDQQFNEALQERAEIVLAKLCEEAGVELTSPFMTIGGERDIAQSLPPSTVTAIATNADTWQKHSANLTVLGGTLAKVHTLFQDSVCRANMALVATQLSQLGRHSQELLRELQHLTLHEATLESALQHSRAATLEWGVYAAHAQQARAMTDLHSPVTLAEISAMALRKLLLRRRQELQSALTVVLLRETESVMAAPAVGFTSPAAEVTAEKVQAASEDCARREALRDRLMRELFFLKKCALRELGAEWMAQTEATALCATAAASSGGDDARRLAETLNDNLRGSSYNSVARVLRMAALPPASISALAGGSHAMGEVDEGQDDAKSPLSPSTAFPPRVQALSLLESVQTRVNSLTSLLLENAQHWQRVKDARVEAKWSCSPSDETWLRTAELLLRRCGDRTDDGDEDLSEETESSRPLLLDLEQQLLDALCASECSVVADMNAALAQLHAQCTAPLQHAKRDVVLLVRLLQLADEAVTNGTVQQRRASPEHTRTTAALESAVQFLCGDAGVHPPPALRDKEEAGDAFDALMDVSSPASLSSSSSNTATTAASLPTLRLPQIPHQVDELQAAVGSVSEEWQQALRNDVEALRLSVTTKQTTLEQYAPYSMAEVPALLEKTRTDVKGLKGQQTALMAQRGAAATLTGQLHEQRRLLDQRTGEQRHTLRAALQTALEERDALEAEVVVLRACKALWEAQSSERHTVQEAEAEEWAAGMTAAENFLRQPIEPVAIKEETVAKAALEELGSVKAEDVGELVNTDTAVKAEDEAEEGGGEAREGEDLGAGYAYDDDEEEAEESRAFASNEYLSAKEGDEEQQDMAEEDELPSGNGSQMGEISRDDGERTSVADEVPSAPALPHAGDSLPEEAEQPAEVSSSGNDSSVNASAPADDADDVAAGQEEEEKEEEDSTCATAHASVALPSIATPPAMDGDEQDEVDVEHGDEETPRSSFQRPEEEEEGHKNIETGHGTVDGAPPINEDVGATWMTASSLPPTRDVAQPNGENGGGGILRDNPSSILGSGATGLPPILFMNSAPAPPQPFMPVLPSPQPRATSTNAVLEDNPFYSGFGFGEE